MASRAVDAMREGRHSAEIVLTGLVLVADASGRLPRDSDEANQVVAVRGAGLAAALDRSAAVGTTARAPARRGSPDSAR
jgi:hypothetical protein